MPPCRLVLLVLCGAALSQAQEQLGGWGEGQKASRTGIQVAPKDFSSLDCALITLQGAWGTHSPAYLLVLSQASPSVSEKASSTEFKLYFQMAATA